MDTVVNLRNAREEGEAAVRAEETHLLLRVRDANDRDAFERLFSRFAPKLKHYLGSLGCEPGTGEGIVQDVMIAVWTKARLFDADKASARTWIYTLVRNRTIDLKRAAAREANAFQLYAHEHGDEASTDPSQMTQAAGAQAAAFLDELPPEQARVLLLAYIEGKSHREIATQLDIPIGTVKSRARLAFQRLRKRMEVTE